MKIKTYLLYKFIQHLVPVYPVYLLLFEAKGLSVQQISMLFVIWSVPSVFLEVPTGVWADNWSRKNLLVIGSLCNTLAYTLWLFSEGFWMFAAGFILWGTAGALTSGSEEALLYDSLKLQGIEDSFDRVYGKGNYYERIAVALSCLSGGFLAMWFGMKLVLAVSVLFMAVCTVIAVSFKEVNYYKDRQTENAGGSKDTLSDAIRLCVGNKLLLMVTALAILVIGVAGMLDEYDSLIADRFGLSMGLVGAWMGFRYFLEALGSRLAFRIRHILVRMGVRDGFESIGLVCIAAGILLGLSGWLGNIKLMPLYALFYMLMSSAAILHEDYVQQNIKEQGRSTVHSVISLAESIYSIGFYCLLSLVFSGVSVLDALVLIAVYIVALCIIIGLIYIRKGKTTAV